MIIIMAVINLILKNQTDITIAKNSHDIVLGNLCKSYSWWSRLMLSRSLRFSFSRNCTVEGAVHGLGVLGHHLDPVEQ